MHSYRPTTLSDFSQLRTRRRLRVVPLRPSWTTLAARLLLTIGLSLCLLAGLAIAMFSIVALDAVLRR